MEEWKTSSSEIGKGARQQQHELRYAALARMEGHDRKVAAALQNAIDAVDGVPDPAVRIDLDRAAGMARLTVSDNGPGIPEAQRAAVFDPFFTTKPVGKGTGLGLSISAKIADEHGGQLSLLPGPGAVFLLELPLAQEPGES